MVLDRSAVPEEKIEFRRPPEGGLAVSMLGSQRWINRSLSAFFCFSLSCSRGGLVGSLGMRTSSEVDPLELERAILRGDGVDTDCRRVLSSGLTGEAGATDAVRTAGVMDLWPAVGSWVEADRAWADAKAPARAATGE